MQVIVRLHWIVEGCAGVYGLKKLRLLEVSNKPSPSVPASHDTRRGTTAAGELLEATLPDCLTLYHIDMLCMLVTIARYSTWYIMPLSVHTNNGVDLWGRYFNCI